MAFSGSKVPRLCRSPRYLKFLGSKSCRNISSSPDVYSKDEEYASDERIPKLYPDYIPTTQLQKVVLFAGSAIAGLSDPWRSDMVAVNGEVASTPALTYMRSRMKNNHEGRLVLKEKPRISTKSVDYDALMALPENTLGRVVATFNEKHGISPDTRAQVRFVDDPELAYVMQRYGEVHDLLHALFNMPTDMVGEVAVKWVEALQFGLPMCVGAAVLGPGRFSKKSQFERYERYREWAIKTGTRSRFLLNVYYELRWEQDIDDLRREMRIAPPPRSKK